MTIDHDTIAAQLRLMSDACACDTDYCEHVEAHDDAPDYDGMSAAYLDLYDEVKRLRAERDEALERETIAANAAVGYLERAEKAEAERDALRAHPYLSAEEISAIEGANRRWHGEYDTTVSVRWEPYKPDGQRQMKAKGRWQTMTHNGSGYFRWENCDRPAQARKALKGQTNE